MSNEEMVEAALRCALKALTPRATWNESSEGVFDVPCNDAARVVVSLREALAKHTADANAALRDAQARSYQVAQSMRPVGKVYRHGRASNGEPWHGVHWFDESVNVPDGTLLYTSRSLEIAAWQDKANPAVLVAAEDWDNIDPIWHWMYRPLYAPKSEEEKSGN